MTVKNFLIFLFVSFIATGCATKSALEDGQKREIYLIKSLAYWPVQLNHSLTGRPYGFITLDSLKVLSESSKKLNVAFQIHLLHFDRYAKDYEQLSQLKIPYFLITVDEKGIIRDRKNFTLTMKPPFMREEEIEMELKLPLAAKTRVYLGFILDPYQEDIIKNPRNFVRKLSLGL